MKSIYLKLKTVEDVKEFATLVSILNIKADVYSVSNSRHVVPADSVLGLFSLNLNDQLNVSFNEEDNEKEFMRKCNRWLIEN